MTTDCFYWILHFLLFLFFYGTGLSTDAGTYLGWPKLIMIPKFITAHFCSCWEEICSIFDLVRKKRDGHQDSFMSRTRPPHETANPWRIGYVQRIAINKTLPLWETDTAALWCVFQQSPLLFSHYSQNTVFIKELLQARPDACRTDIIAGWVSRSDHGSHMSPSSPLPTQSSFEWKI